MTTWVTDQTQTHADWCWPKGKGKCGLGGLLAFAGLKLTMRVLWTGGRYRRVNLLTGREVPVFRCRVIDRFFIDDLYWRKVRGERLSDREKELVKRRAEG